MSRLKSPGKPGQNPREVEFFAACKGGRTADVLLMLKSGVNIGAREQDPLGLSQTALHHAARNGRMEICQTLIDNGAEVEAVNTRKQTALHEAAMHGQFAVCRLLVRHGANLNAVDAQKRTPLYWAAAEDRETYRLQNYKTTYLELLGRGAIYAELKPHGMGREICRMQGLTRLQAASEMQGVEALCHLLITDDEQTTLPQRVRAVLENNQDVAIRDDTDFVLRSWLSSHAARDLLAQMELPAPNASRPSP